MRSLRAQRAATSPTTSSTRVPCAGTLRVALGRSNRAHQTPPSSSSRRGPIRGPCTTERGSPSPGVLCFSRGAHRSLFVLCLAALSVTPALAAAGAVSRPGLDAAPGDELRRSPAAFKKTPKFYTLLPGAAKHATYYEESCVASRAAEDAITTPSVDGLRGDGLGPTRGDEQRPSSASEAKTGAPAALREGGDRGGARVFVGFRERRQRESDSFVDGRKIVVPERPCLGACSRKSMRKRWRGGGAGLSSKLDYGAPDDKGTETTPPRVDGALGGLLCDVSGNEPPRPSNKTVSPPLDWRRGCGEALGGGFGGGLGGTPAPCERPPRGAPQDKITTTGSDCGDEQQWLPPPEDKNMIPFTDGRHEVRRTHTRPHSRPPLPPTNAGLTNLEDAPTRNKLTALRAKPSEPHMETSHVAGCIRAGTTMEHETHPPGSGSKLTLTSKQKEQNVRDPILLAGGGDSRGGLRVVGGATSTFILPSVESEPTHATRGKEWPIAP